MIIEEINEIDEGSQKMPQKKYIIQVDYTTNVWEKMKNKNKK
ncbi:hypothetical protein [Eisenbergiella sp.]